MTLSEWKCPQCMINRTAKFCGSCGVQMPAPIKTVVGKRPKGSEDGAPNKKKQKLVDVTPSTCMSDEDQDDPAEEVVYSGPMFDKTQPAPEKKKKKKKADRVTPSTVMSDEDQDDPAEEVVYSGPMFDKTRPTPEPIDSSSGEDSDGLVDSDPEPIPVPSPKVAKSTKKKKKSPPSKPKEILPPKDMSKKAPRLKAPEFKSTANVSGTPKETLDALPFLLRQLNAEIQLDYRRLKNRVSRLRKLGDYKKGRYGRRLDITVIMKTVEKDDDSDVERATFNLYDVEPRIVNHMLVNHYNDTVAMLRNTSNQGHDYQFTEEEALTAILSDSKCTPRYRATDATVVDPNP